ncbi:MAG TPA: hypothetical protein VEB68_01645 [Croceibacterium sp.]|nr:hypothetical protein [Croceibacterium sp.]
MLIAVSTLILAGVAVFLALRWGGRPEHWGARVIVAMILLTYAGHAFFPRLFRSVDPVALAVDIVGLIGFTAIGLTYRRVWPLWAASLQLLSSGAHFVRALSIPIEGRAYFWMKTSPTWIVMVLLIAGTLAHQQRVRQRRNESSLPD